jgi:hypothetical protein
MSAKITYRKIFLIVNKEKTTPLFPLLGKERETEGEVIIIIHTPHKKHSYRKTLHFVQEKGIVKFQALYLRV